MTTIDIPVRELHARTGHYIRKVNENMRIVVTDRGRPVAEIQPLGNTGGRGPARKWSERALVPEYKKIMKKPIGGTDSAEMISEERDRGSVP
jgi:prevent-host-death family protein